MEKKYNILIAEDNNVTRSFLERLFEMKNWLFTAVENGLEAVEIVNEHQFDLILMDIEMPFMDGIEASKEIKKKPGYQDVPIVALTAHILDWDEEKILSEGLNGFIEKPIKINDFYNIIENYLKKS